MQSLLLFKNSSNSLNRLEKHLRVTYKNILYITRTKYNAKFDTKSIVTTNNLLKDILSGLLNKNFTSKDKYLIYLFGNRLSKINSLGSNLFRARSIVLFDKTPSRSQQQSSGNESSSSGNQNQNQNKPPNRNVILAVLFVNILYFIYLNQALKQQQLLLEQSKKDEENRTKQIQKPNVNVNKTSVNKEESFDLFFENEAPVQSVEIQPQASAVPRGDSKIQVIKGSVNTITWNVFVNELLAKGLVKEICARKNSNTVEVFLIHPVPINSNFRTYFFKMEVSDLENKLEKAQNDLNLKQEDRLQINYSKYEKIENDTSNVFNLLFFGTILYLFFRFRKNFSEKMKDTGSMNMFSQMTKAKFTVVDPHLKAGVPKVSFKDVAGLHEAKIEVKEFVDYLTEPERFVKLGARVPKGALLLGPPGCGKTLLAKAVAAESNVPFFYIAGTEFVEIIGGVGASRVRSLFEEAKKQSPSIIYIDEIDAVGRKRSDNTGGGTGEMDQTLNQLLVSMDGLESNSNVIVLASTNRSDILDKALLRPGRLDRHISIDLPTYLERIEILNVHMKNLKMNSDKNAKDELISDLSHLTPRFSGADLANICNEAALIAAREGLESITRKEFFSALERVVGGAEKKNSTISVEDRKMIAYHECGQILVSWYHQYADLLLKVSLISRTKMNSFAQYMPSENKIISKEQLFDQMCMQFGGRLAELLVFNRMTTNSEKDLKKITRMAYAQIESYGMSDVVGNISFPTIYEEKAMNNFAGKRPYSKKLRSIIDTEVNKLINSAFDETERTIKKNIDKLHILSEELLKKETLTYHDIVKLIGPPENPGRYTVARLESTENLKSSEEKIPKSEST